MDAAAPAGLLPRIAAEIAADGPVSVARYMDLCLHDPAGGYYAVRPALGADGDFVTAPLVSRMFGEMLGLWCAGVWTALDRPDPVRWVEVGPGDGTLAADMRRTCARALPAFVAAAELVLVETSAPLRALQAQALGAAPPRWAATLQEADGPGPLVLVANELLDCLPARQFTRTERGWAERRVGLDAAGRLAFGLAPAPAGFLPPPGLEHVAPGLVVEVSDAQARLGAEVGARVVRDGGAALFVDYGRDRPGAGDTLQALRRHAKVDPLASPGEADLTVHADFPAFAAAARTAGAAATPVLTQGDFLRRLGIEVRADALARARPDKADLVRRQLDRLTGGDAVGGMGELFKVICIHRPGFVPPGFEEAA